MSVLFDLSTIIIVFLAIEATRIFIRPFSGSSLRRSADADMRILCGRTS
jgi:hypothetical protein